jgi:NifB/MoaA-like Fe-S oxidoreductase
MHDRDAKTAVKAPYFLSKNHISFHGSLVAQPSITGWDDIERTIELFAQCHAKTVRVFLPGYTKWYQGNSQEVISRKSLMEFARQMTIQYDLPVLAEPPLLEGLDAVVEGAVRGSAADRCGIHPGTVIRKVNEIPVLSRFHAYELCRDTESPLLSIDAAHDEIIVRLDKGAGESSGLVFYHDADPGRFQAINKIAGDPDDRILVLTSTLAFKIVAAAWSQWLPHLPSAEIRAVDNRFFGGTIMAAGLLMVEDFIAAIQNLNKKKENYDMIMIPEEPFDHKGCDLIGKSYREIEEYSGCRVVLV